LAASVRISSGSWKMLKEMADTMGETMQVVLDQAIESYRRQLLLEKTNAAYAALKSEEEKWDEEIAEREEWDVALADGLDGDR